MCEMYHSFGKGIHDTCKQWENKHKKGYDTTYVYVYYTCIPLTYYKGDIHSDAGTRLYPIVLSSVRLLCGHGCKLEHVFCCSLNV